MVKKIFNLILIIFLLKAFVLSAFAEEKLLGCSYNAKITDIAYGGDTVEFKSGIDFFKINDTNKNFGWNCLLCKIGAEEFENSYIEKYIYDNEKIILAAKVKDNGRPREVHLKIDRIAGSYLLNMQVKSWGFLRKTAPSTYYQAEGVCKQVSTEQKF